MPDSHEADLPVDFARGAQPGDIARALGGVLPGDRVDVVLRDRSARSLIIKTLADRAPSLPFLARVLDVDSRDPGILRLVDELHLSTDNSNAPNTRKMLDALLTWHRAGGDLNMFVDATTNIITSASTDDSPITSWRHTGGGIEIETSIDIDTAGIVVVLSSDARVSVVGPVASVEERAGRICVGWPFVETIKRIDLVVQRQEPADSQD